MQSQNNQTTEQLENNGDCLSPKELVQRHLQNKDHQISDEDLEKVELDCSASTDEDATSAVTLDSGNVLQDRTEDDEPDGKEEKDIAPTPLDVLS